MGSADIIHKANGALKALRQVVVQVVPPQFFFEICNLRVAVDQ